MGMDFLDLGFRLDKAFGTQLPKSLVDDAADHDRRDVQAGEIHNQVCAFLTQSGHRVPPSSWHRVQLCISRMLRISPTKVRPETWLISELGFCKPIINGSLSWDFPTVPATLAPSMQAGTLNCPQCGAAISQDATRCQYCSALLQTVACPRCLKMMFAGSKYCPHCGALAENVAQGKKTPHVCPRCHIAMNNVQVADTPLEQCPRCGGAWVSVAGFEHLCEVADAQQVATGYKLPPKPKIDSNVRYLPCPQCQKLMSRVNYAGRSGVVIDVCRPHGIWLDRDEMRQIIEFIRAGGIQRAREIELVHLEDARRRTGGEPPRTE